MAKLYNWGPFVYGDRSLPVVGAIRELLMDGEWHTGRELFYTGRVVDSDLLDDTIRNIIYRLAQHGVTEKRRLEPKVKNEKQYRLTDLYWLM